MSDERTWQSYLRELYRGFQRMDDQRVLISRIADSILADEATPSYERLQALFDRTIQDFSRIHGLEEAGRCYMYLGDELSLLSEVPSSTPWPSSLPISPAVNRLLMPQDQSFASVTLNSADDQDALFDPIAPPFATILLCPLYTPARELLCVFLFADRRLPEGSRLVESEFQGPLAHMVRELSVAYRRVADSQHRVAMEALWSTFLRSHLSPEVCFASLAEAISSFIPQFGPSMLRTTPEVQILMLQQAVGAGSASYLLIRGTTGSEPVDTKIDVDNSISGLLVKRSPEELPFFYDDPTHPEWGNLYRGYLAPESHIETELAFRLLNTQGDTIGVLNLESPGRGAFNVHHRAAVRELAALIGPIVEELERGIRQSRFMHLSVATTAGAYLGSRTRDFRHLIDPKFSTVAGRASNIMKLVDQLSATPLLSESSREQRLLEAIAHEARATLEANRNGLDLVEAFSDDIAFRGGLGRMNLRMLLSRAMRAAQGQAQGIEINLGEGPEAYTYCSGDFAMQVFALLENAILSIRERQETDSLPGEIAMSIAEGESLPEGQEVSLNRQWVVTIRDNGKGVGGQELEMLRAYEEGRRYRRSEGKGYGLAAVNRYVRTLRGRMEIDGSDGGFEVRLFLDQYDERIHGHEERAAADVSNTKVDGSDGDAT